MGVRLRLQTGPWPFSGPEEIGAKEQGEFQTEELTDLDLTPTSVLQQLGEPQG